VGVEWTVGDYAAWTYFQSLPTETNRTFVERFQRRYGQDRQVDDPMEAAYVGVHLWAQAAEAAGTEEPRAVRTALRARAILGPSGLAYMDPELLHLWKTPRIGRIRPDGQFDIVWSARKPMPPVPFPISRSREEWEQLVQERHRSSPAEPVVEGGAP
jgi:urea transport system substrate-binding protein